jgi:16S rRNA (uracil1498-N3)-methyltransferase
MTRRRWIADEVSGDRVAIVGEHARHLAQVLRAQPGQEFDISTGAEIRHGRITSIRPDRVEFELGEVVAQPAEPNVTIALSIFKFDRLEWAIEKCTELAVARIIPVMAGRTEKHLAAAAAKRVERWHRIARQASEQSRSSSPPEISDPIKLRDLFEIPGDNRIVLDENERERLLIDALSADVPTTTLAIGPEGGWRPEEVAGFRSAGWTTASLGQTVLRAETAAIAALAIVNSIHLRSREK